MMLPDPSATDDWVNVVKNTVAQYRTATIQVLDPLSFTEDAPYNAVTDTGGNRVYKVLWTGLARVQAMAIQRSIGADEFTSKRLFHLDIDLTADLPFMHKGHQIRVISGGAGLSLVNISLTILSAIDSSIGVQRNFEAVTEGAGVPLV